MVYWLWDLRLVTSMVRDTFVKWVSDTAITSVSIPESKTLFPSNPDGLQIPNGQVLELAAADGPGVLASPILHWAMLKKLNIMINHKRNLVAREHGLATGRDFWLWLPHRHSYRPFFDKMVSSFVIWSSNILAIWQL